MIGFLRRLFSRRRPAGVNLYVMRLTDMVRMHPDQITARCSRCGTDVGVYPSGQKVMREMKDVKLICNECGLPPLNAALAPGAAQEPLQSVRKQ